MFFLLCVIYSKILVASSQFPNHMDLQYFGEVTSNKEKYKILKPSVHIIEDYFKSYVLRTKDSKFPNKKVLLDDNGFRHHWEDVKDDSRKTEPFATLNETQTYDVNKTNSNVDIYGLLSRMRNIITDISEKPSNNTSEPAIEKDTNKDSPETTPETQTEVTFSSPFVESVTQTVENVKEKPKRRVKLEKKENEKNSQKKKVKTSFFCPFFGVITMTSYID